MWVLGPHQHNPICSVPNVHFVLCARNMYHYFNGKTVFLTIGIGTIRAVQFSWYTSADFDNLDGLNSTLLLVLTPYTPLSSKLRSLSGSATINPVRWRTLLIPGFHCGNWEHSSNGWLDTPGISVLNFGYSSPNVVTVFIHANPYCFCH